MLLKRRQPDKPAAALNKFCSICTSNGLYTESGIDPGLIILSLTGAAVAAKRGAHLGLTVLTDFFPAKGQKFCTLLGDLMGIVFGVLILWFGYLMAKQEYVLGQLTAGMQWPEWMFGMFVPISGGVLVIRYIQLFITHLVKKEEK